MNAVEIYEQAKRRIQERKHDERDELIVAQWTHLERLVIDNKGLRAELDEAKKAQCQAAFALEIAQSRNAVANTPRVYSEGAPAVLN